MLKLTFLPVVLALTSVAVPQDLPQLYVQNHAGVDLEYLQEEVGFVSFVRNRTAADVMLTLTCQPTGSGGTEYLFVFAGRGRFAGLGYELTWASEPASSSEETNEGLSEVLMRGLVPYVAQTDAGEFVYVEYDPEDEEFPRVEDSWRSWVFGIDVEGSASGEEFSSEYGLEGGFWVSRVTRQSRLSFGPEVSVSEERELDEEGELEFHEVTRSYSLSGQYGRMLAQHFALGARVAAENDEPANLRTSVAVGSMLEMSLFPYREHRRHDVRLTWWFDGVHNDYYDTTAFGKTRELVARHEARAKVSLARDWGDIGASVTWSNYLHDFSLNRLTLGAEISLELGEGFGVEVSGSYSFIHDQIALRQDPEGEYEKPTDFSFDVSVGLSYEFGSIYAAVVNPVFQ